MGLPGFFRGALKRAQNSSGAEGMSPVGAHFAPKALVPREFQQFPVNHKGVIRPEFPAPNSWLAPKGARTPPAFPGPKVSLGRPGDPRPQVS